VAGYVVLSGLVTRADCGARYAVGDSSDMEGTDEARAGVKLTVRESSTAVLPAETRRRVRGEASLYSDRLTPAALSSLRRSIECSNSASSIWGLLASMSLMSGS